jgi:putative RNA 2'-phosphotransferase
VLRHRPDKIGIELDENGWTSTEILIQKMNDQGFRIDQEKLEAIVKDNDKQRYALNEAKTLIRANQGHSLIVDLEYDPLTPPEYLYHGTADRFLDSILKSGLEKRNRHHVHLSADIETATKVGTRHGRVIILKILSGNMHKIGYKFYKSENGVWLTESVPVEYIEIMG